MFRPHDHTNQGYDEIHVNKIAGFTVTYLDSQTWPLSETLRPPKGSAYHSSQFFKPVLELFDPHPNFQLRDSCCI